MNEQDKRYRIVRAKEVLRDIHHIPIATVNMAGSPHSSPVFLVFDEALHGFWASSPDSLHSQNITRDPRIFLSIFDSREGHSGLFLSGTAIELTERSRVVHGLKALTDLKEKGYGKMNDISGYLETGPQRIYEFVPDHAWVNHSEKHGDIVVGDGRYEIALTDLIADE
jgi:hypothetical protein